MDRRLAHSNIVKFLKNQTSLKRDLTMAIAMKHASGGNKNPSLTDVQNYLAMHNAEINEEANEAISSVAWKMLPENYFIALVKRYDLWAVLLVPPLYSLFVYIFHLFEQTPRDWESISGVAVSIVLLLVILVSSLVANILRNR